MLSARCCVPRKGETREMEWLRGRGAGTGKNPVADLPRPRLYWSRHGRGVLKTAVTTTKSLQEEIRAMKKFVLGALYALCIVSFPAAAQGTLNSYQTVDIIASMSTVWSSLKEYIGCHVCKPMFSDDELKSG